MDLFESTIDSLLNDNIIAGFVEGTRDISFFRQHNEFERKQNIILKYISCNSRVPVKMHENMVIQSEKILLEGWERPFADAIDAYLGNHGLSEITLVFCLKLFVHVMFSMQFRHVTIPGDWENILCGIWQVCRYDQPPKKLVASVAIALVKTLIGRVDELGVSALAPIFQDWMAREREYLVQLAISEPTALEINDKMHAFLAKYLN